MVGKKYKKNTKKIIIMKKEARTWPHAAQTSAPCGPPGRRCAAPQNHSASRGLWFVHCSIFFIFVSNQPERNKTKQKKGRTICSLSRNQKPKPGTHTTHQITKTAALPTFLPSTQQKKNQRCSRIRDSFGEYETLVHSRISIIS
jgi:hypothetical protein